VSPAEASRFVTVANRLFVQSLPTFWVKLLPWRAGGSRFHLADFTRDPWGPYADDPLPVQVREVRARVDQSQGQRNSGVLPAAWLSEPIDLHAPACEQLLMYGELERDGGSQLFEDVKAADLIWKAPATSYRITGEVAAAERGTRHHPDGTTEDYERIEFRRCG
jgi:hypothetical protein